MLDAAAAAAGIEPVGGMVNAERSFTVETISAGRGQLNVTVTNPLGVQEPVSLIHLSLSSCVRRCEMKFSVEKIVKFYEGLWKLSRPCCCEFFVQFFFVIS